MSIFDKKPKILLYLSIGFVIGSLSSVFDSLSQLIIFAIAFGLYTGSLYRVLKCKGQNDTH